MVAASEGLTHEATQIAHARMTAAAITPGDISLYLEWLKIIAQAIRDCRERRAGNSGQSWAFIRGQWSEERQVRRIHARVVRQLGPQTAKSYGGIETTRYILGRYRRHPAAELEAMIAEATAA